MLQDRRALADIEQISDRRAKVTVTVNKPIYRHLQKYLYKGLCHELSTNYVSGRTDYDHMALASLGVYKK